MAVSSASGEMSPRARLLHDLDVAFRIGSAQSVIFSQAAADRLGIASSDMECYDLLSLHGSMTAGRLAELTGLTTGAITGVVDRLERGGYARRERDQNDRRRVIVHPVLERQAEAMPLFGPLTAATLAVLERYSDDELALLLGILTRLNDVMHDQIARVRAEPRESRGA